MRPKYHHTITVVRAGIEFQSGCPWGVWCQKQHEGSKGPCRSLVEGCRGRTVPHWKKLKSYYTKRHFPSFFNHFLVHTCPQYMYFSISMYTFFCLLFFSFSLFLFLFFPFLFSLFAGFFSIHYSLQQIIFFDPALRPAPFLLPPCDILKAKQYNSKRNNVTAAQWTIFKINEDVTYAPF